MIVQTAIGSKKETTSINVSFNASKTVINKIVITFS